MIVQILADKKTVQANNNTWTCGFCTNVTTPTLIMINSYGDIEQGLGNVILTEKANMRIVF